MAVQQQQGIGTLAYPFYVAEYSRDPKPQPTSIDATLFVIETRETFVWKDGTWRLYGSPTSADAVILGGLLAGILATDRSILREIRLIRQGQMAATTCLEIAGSDTDSDADEQPI